MTGEDKNELLSLAEEYINRSLSEERLGRLDTLLQDNTEARRLFIDYMQIHASMSQEFVQQGEVVGFPVEEDEPTKTKRWPILQIAAVLLFFLIGAGLVSLLLFPARGVSYATIDFSSGAVWGGSELPTTTGSRLGSGRLSLIEGLVTVHFDSGAQVNLEAPAAIEIIDSMSMMLENGTIVATIPESAIGFTVNTPNADVVDYGTVFAVKVDLETQATRTQVLEGEVEVTNLETNESVELSTGESSVSRLDQIAKSDTSGEFGDFDVEQIGEVSEFQSVLADEGIYVQGRSRGKIKFSRHLLYVKNSIVGPAFSRKAYIGFDLSDVATKRLEDAKIVLNFASTQVGLASLVPDATFTVYGLNKPIEWSREEITWENAPANDTETGSGVINSEVTRLDSFVVRKGQQRGEFTIQGPALLDFLSEVDGSATVIVVRETPEVRGGGLVHGIVSHRHPSLPGPVLQVKAF